MKIISIGMGQNIFDDKSAIRRRMIEYGKIFDQLHAIVFTEDKPQLANEKIAENVFLYPTKSKIRIFYFFDYLKITRNIIKKIGKENVVLTVQDPFETGIVGLMLKFLYKLPLQIQIHTDFSNKYFIFHSVLNAVRFVVGEIVLSFADSVRVVSEKIAKSLHNKPECVSVLPVYVESEIRNPKSETKKNGNQINFLTVARLEKEKDLRTAILSFKKILDKGIKAKLVIVGDGGERVSLEKLTRDLKIENNVQFAGWRDDLKEFYENADVYISTSLFEGYGMSVVEAASYGLPLILSKTGVAGEIFSDGMGAMVCEQKNVDQFTAAMEKLSADRSLREVVGQKAREASESVLISKDEYLRRYAESIALAAKLGAEGDIFKNNILLRYLVAGITSASSQIILLYIFTDIAGIWYLYSSALAFIVAIVVSFLLQKFWTFGDKSTDKVRSQFAKYVSVGILGIAVNTGSMFVLVDILGIWYILAQIITGAFIAVLNFIMYKFFIFRK